MAQCAYRGKDAGDHCGEQAEKGEECEDTPVEVNGLCQRQMVLELRPEQLDGGLPEEQTRQRAKAAEQEAFDDRLLEETAAGSSERRAHRLFAASSQSSSEH